MNIRSLIVSKELREYVRKEYTEVFAKEDYTVFFTWLAFYVPDDNYHQQERVISKVYLSYLLRRTETNYSGEKFFEQFQRDTGINLNIVEYIYKDKARKVSPDLSEDLLRRIKEEVKIPRQDKNDPVYFVAGDKVTDRKDAKMRKEDHDYYYSKLDSDNIIVKYFQETSTTIYNPYYDNIDTLIKDINESQDMIEKEKDFFRMALTHLASNLDPHYFQKADKEGFGRIFADGFSLQTISSDLRGKILKGCKVIDIKSCHTIIAAYDWEAPILRKVLDSGESIWNYFQQELGFPVLTTAKKKGLKKGLYAVIYGGGLEKIKEELGDCISDSEKESFITHPLIVELRKKSKEKTKEIEANKGITLVDGKFERYRGGKPSALLTWKAQHIEMLVISTCYEIAKKYPKTVRILSHEHDGITVRILDSSKEDWIISKMEAAAAAKAKELGFPLELEVKG